MRLAHPEPVIKLCQRPCGRGPTTFEKIDWMSVRPEINSVEMEKLSFKYEYTLLTNRISNTSEQEADEKFGKS